MAARGVPDLAGTVLQSDTTGQRFMRFEPLVRVYERVWRPLFTAVAGGRSPEEETATLARWLEPAPGSCLLDLACGPGNTTRRLAEEVPRGGVLGVDLSTPMLERAMAEAAPTNGNRRQPHGWVAYARADAHRLALADGAFDGVHCAAALYLVSDPRQVVAEAARVLRPGGVFAGMTLVNPLALRTPVTSRLTGVRPVTERQLRRHCEEAGLAGLQVERRGGSLLFAARRPS